MFLSSISSTGPSIGRPNLAARAQQLGPGSLQRSQTLSTARHTPSVTTAGVPERASTVVGRQTAPASCQSASPQPSGTSRSGVQDRLTAALVILGVPGVSLLWPNISWAEEAFEATQEAVEASAAGDVSVGNRFIGVLFTGAVVALGVITLGTIYLSLSQFKDGRNEKADLAKWTPEERNAKGPAVKQQQKSTKRKQYVSAKGGGKGFGDFGPGESEF